MLRLALCAVMLAVLLLSPSSSAQPITWEVKQPLVIWAGEQGVLTIELQNEGAEAVDGELSIELVSVVKDFDVEREANVSQLIHPPRLRITVHSVHLEPGAGGEFSFPITTHPSTPPGVYRGMVLLNTGSRLVLGECAFCVRKKGYLSILVLVLTTCILAVLILYTWRREHH